MGGAYSENEGSHVAFGGTAEHVRPPPPHTRMRASKAGQDPFSSNQQGERYLSHSVLWYQKTRAAPPAGSGGTHSL